MKSMVVPLVLVALALGLIARNFGAFAETSNDCSGILAYGYGETVPGGGYASADEAIATLFGQQLADQATLVDGAAADDEFQYAVADDYLFVHQGEGGFLVDRVISCGGLGP